MTFTVDGDGLLGLGLAEADGATDSDGIGVRLGAPSSVPDSRTAWMSSLDDTQTAASASNIATASSSDTTSRRSDLTDPTTRCPEEHERREQ